MRNIKYKKEVMSVFGPVVVLVTLLSSISCSFSPPAATVGKKSIPIAVLKFVPYSKDNALIAYFSLADSATNQVASDGQLRIQVYSSVGVSLGDSGSAMKLKRSFYDNHFEIGATNFHWESFGALLNVQDLAFRFAIPYENFQLPVKKGGMVTVEMEFTPIYTSQELSAKRNVVLY